MSKRKMRKEAAEVDHVSQYFSEELPVKMNLRVRSKQNDLSHPIDKPSVNDRRELDETSVVATKDIEDLKCWQPMHWKEVLAMIQSMRSAKDAPVDTMGCDQCADENAPEPTKRLHLLLSLMLSSQTKDQVTFAAMARLRSIPGGLNIDTLMALSDEEVGKLIYPVGFWKTKVRHIKATCAVLKEQYNGDIPSTAEGLCKLPGVGPKMAHLCMQSAWGVVSGIGVDTHVHRIANRLKWVRKPTKTPEQTRNELESWLPKDLWSEVNHLLVGLGQTICKPVQPNCSDCLAKHLCPSAGKPTPPKKKKS